MNIPIFTLSIRYERDVVTARRRARQIAELIQFDTQDQTRIATAVSEIARNAFTYAGDGTISFAIEGDEQGRDLVITVTDKGPGIAQLDAILTGRYHSPTGMGLGIIGARRLMDAFVISSQPGIGTTVTLRKTVPSRAARIGVNELTPLLDSLLGLEPQDPVDEMGRQNKELLRTLDELMERQEELTRLNLELEETNRGVVALYAELDEKAERLREADQLKSRFLSYMSHEFRTPLNSILALSHILLDRMDGEINAEQEKQVSFIRKAAEDLTGLVDDLLDLAKVQAGKIEIRPSPFDVGDLFGTLRSLSRLVTNSENVDLVFEMPDVPLMVNADEGKLSQILRNFISNALKFTDRGEIRTAVRLLDGGRTVAFEVSDTGIGIAPEHQETIFQEFTQIDNPVQRRVKGTGLGLPLSRKLAELMGGSVAVRSTPGIGSTFVVTIPRGLELEATADSLPQESEPADKALTVLSIDDEDLHRYLLRRTLSTSRYRFEEAGNGIQGMEKAREIRPDIIFLDLMMPDMTGFELLRRLRGEPETSAIPVIILTSKSLTDDERRELAAGAANIIPKEKLSYDIVTESIEHALSPGAGHAGEHANRRQEP